LILVALPGVIFGSMVRAFAPGEAECVPASSGLLSLFAGRLCPPTDADYAVLLPIGLIVAVAVIVVGVVRVRSY
jgi:hypothetical protein